MGEEKREYCFIYANRLKQDRDAFERITRDYGTVRREYIVNSPSVTPEDIQWETVEYRLGEIVKAVGSKESVRVVLAGFSPLVALVYSVATAMELPCCYFVKDERTQQYVEITAF